MELQDGPSQAGTGPWWEGKCDLEDCLWLCSAPPLPARPAPWSPCSGSPPSFPFQTDSLKGEGPPCTALSTALQLAVAAMTLSPFRGPRQRRLPPPSRPEADATGAHGNHVGGGGRHRSLTCSFILSFIHSADVPRTLPGCQVSHGKSGVSWPVLLSSEAAGGTRPSSVRLQLRPGPR